LLNRDICRSAAVVSLAPLLDVPCDHKSIAEWPRRGTAASFGLKPVVGVGCVSQAELGCEDCPRIVRQEAVELFRNAFPVRGMDVRKWILIHHIIEFNIGGIAGSRLLLPNDTSRRE
jgi:hypothetical protein